MDRRGFLLGLAGAAGTMVAAGTLLSPAQATTLSQVKDFTPPDGLPEDALAEDALADEALATPDGTPVEPAHWGPPGPPPGYWRRRRRRWRRRQRRVCRRAWNRWGRPYRRCRWVWY
ncbi:hypothetical protein [Ancylobacter novellus]|nr:hypothetical protein [Ancylobacter novellus]